MATVARTGAAARVRRSLWLFWGYLGLAGLLAACLVISLSAGHGEHPPPGIAGIYDVRGSSCLGKSFRIDQSGQFVNLSEGPSGKLRLQHERLTGTAGCAGGGSAAVALDVGGTADKRVLTGTVGDARAKLTFSAPLPVPGASAKPIKRSSEETFGRLMLAMAVVILAARALGIALGKIGQPRVMGEVLAGILLGPTLLGVVFPGVKDYLFPTDIVPLLSAAAQIGLAFYLFLVGMELDVSKVRRQIARAALVSNASVAVPLSLGLLVALPVFKLLAPDVKYLPFALFMGVSMSITAFPVLARILVERRMLRNRVGVLALSSAAIDDVTAWGLLALATAVAGTGSGIDALVVVGWTALFTAGMILVGRRILARASTAYDEVGQVPALWLGIIVVGVLLSAFAAQQIGVAAIFGAFVMGLIMPRNTGLTEDVSRRLEQFVVLVLLPLFFVVTGLKTDVGSLDRWELWLVALLLLIVAIVGKWVGALIASRISGLNWRDSTIVGALMNTRGLTELIVLNIGLDLGIISRDLFTMLVVMALVTTFMAGPALRLLDPRKELSEPVEKELRRLVRRQGPRPTAERSILVAPQDEPSVDPLLSIAAPLARAEPRRELVVVRLLSPARLSAGTSTEDREMREAVDALNGRRRALEDEGIETRAVAFTSPDRARDLLDLASDERVDLVLLNGRRPLAGEPIPGGPIKGLLLEAPCDVAILVERKGKLELGKKNPVIVPFGGADHDWAALELAAAVASAEGAPLRLLGAASTNGERDASRLLANAALTVQQLGGVETESALVTPGMDVVEETRSGGLVVLGMPEKWRDEGLGPVRREIASGSRGPVLFVRRGARGGTLAPGDNLTRFRWSAVGPARS